MMKCYVLNRLLVVVFLSLMVVSCNYQFNSYAKAWNPYSPMKVLVFESDKGQKDSIFIYNIKDEQQGEKNTISVNYDLLHNGVPAESKEAFWLLNIETWNNNTGLISFSLNTPNASFGPYQAKRISWIDSLPKENFEVYGIMYKDILILQPDSTLPGYQQNALQNSFITKMLWSKTNGVVRYYLKDGTRWELVKKYSL